MGAEGPTTVRADPSAGTATALSVRPPGSAKVLYAHLACYQLEKSRTEPLGKQTTELGGLSEPWGLGLSM